MTTPNTEQGSIYEAAVACRKILADIVEPGVLVSEQRCGAQFVNRLFYIWTGQVQVFAPVKTHTDARFVDCGSDARMLLNFLVGFECFLFEEINGLFPLLVFGPSLSLPYINDGLSRSCASAQRNRCTSTFRGVPDKGSNSMKDWENTLRELDSLIEHVGSRSTFAAEACCTSRKYNVKKKRKVQYRSRIM